MRDELGLIDKFKPVAVNAIANDSTFDGMCREVSDSEAEWLRVPVVSYCRGEHVSKVIEFITQSFSPDCKSAV